MHEDIAGVICSENVLTDEILIAGFLNRFLQDLRAVRKFTPNIDVGLLHVIRETRDHRALDQLMRILMHDVAILESARLGFIGIHDQIDRLAALTIDQPPLHATGKTGAAATTEAGLFNFLTEVFGLLRDRFLEDFVATVALIAIDVVGVTLFVDVLENDASLFRHGV